MAKPTRDADVIDLFRGELQLCGVGDGQTVAVLSQGDGTRGYADAFLAAADSLGASAVDVNLPSQQSLSANERLKDFGRNPLSENPEAMDTLKNADMVVDLMVVSFSKEQDEIQDAGGRILLVAEPVETLRRMFPSQDLRRRVEAAEARLANARHLRFTNDAGSDVTYEFGDCPVIAEYGYTDTPGRWDHFPAGLVATCATDTGVNGRVVMNRNDMLLPQLKCLEDPIEFSIRDGYVTDIKGGKEAGRLRDLMEGYDDPRAYSVSHIGWGLNERCEWRVDRPGSIGMDGRSYHGNVLFSLGPNTEFGGTNDTACHLDLPMLGSTLYLDGEMIIENGQILTDDMRAPEG